MTEQVLRGFPLTSRFTLLPTPVVSPGKCAVCGAVDMPVVDFGATIEFYGAVLLCSSCLCEAASGVGMVAESLLTEAREELAQSFDSQLETRNLVAVSHDFIYALSGILTSVSDYVLPAHNRSDDVVATPTAQAEPTLFDDSTDDDATESDDFDSAVGSIEQDDYATVGERPDSVSASSEHGSNVFNL